MNALKKCIWFIQQEWLLGMNHKAAIYLSANAPQLT